MPAVRSVRELSFAAGIGNAAGAALVLGPFSPGTRINSVWVVSQTNGGVLPLGPVTVTRFAVGRRPASSYVPASAEVFDRFGVMVSAALLGGHYSAAETAFIGGGLLLPWGFVCQQDSGFVGVRIENASGTTSTFTMCLDVTEPPVGK